MRATVQQAGINMDDGTYEATLVAIDSMQGRDAEGQPRTYWQWTFHAYDTDEGHAVMGFSSTAFGQRSKAYKWICQILGRQLAPEEVFDSEQYCPLECQIVIGPNEKGERRILEALGVRKRPRPTRPENRPAPDNGNDIPF